MHAILPRGLAESRQPGLHSSFALNLSTASVPRPGLACIVDLTSPITPAWCARDACACAFRMRAWPSCPVGRATVVFLHARALCTLPACAHFLLAGTRAQESPIALAVRRFVRALYRQCLANTFAHGMIVRAFHVFTQACRCSMMRTSRITDGAAGGEPVWRGQRRKMPAIVPAPSAVTPCAATVRSPLAHVRFDTPVNAAPLHLIYNQTSLSEPLPVKHHKPPELQCTDTARRVAARKSSPAQQAYQTAYNAQRRTCQKSLPS